MPVWLVILIGLVSMVSTIGNIIVALFMRISKGNFAEFRSEMLEIINKKLDAFVKKSDLALQTESHSREHKHLEEEVIKLRAFKHDVGAEIRKTGAIVDDVKEAIKDVKEDIKDIQKDGV